MRRLALLLLALPLATAQEPAGVRALRYRVLVHESACDLVHGGGQWIDELYLPDHGVVCNVTGEPAPTKEDPFATRHRMHAFKGKIRNVFAETVNGEPQEHPTEELRIPRELAERILELADLTERQRRLAETAAAAARDAGVLK
jgi:hypothetical protein